MLWLCSLSHSTLGGLFSPLHGCEKGSSLGRGHGWSPGVTGRGPELPPPPPQKDATETAPGNGGAGAKVLQGSEDLASIPDLEQRGRTGRG